MHSITKTKSNFAICNNSVLNHITILLPSPESTIPRALSAVSKVTMNQSNSFLRIFKLFYKCYSGMKTAQKNLEKPESKTKGRGCMCE